MGVTLELWSDPENDGELSCCSAQAVRGRTRARTRARPGALLDRPAGRVPCGRGREWLADHAAGLTPNPCVRCNGSVRLDAMLELADRLGSDALATGHYARVSEGPLLRTAADVCQGPELRPVRTRPRFAGADALPAGGDAQASGARSRRARPASPVARRRDSQDLCFLAGTASGRFLERHGGLGQRPGTDRRRRRRDARRARAERTVYTVGQRHGLGISASEPLYVLATDTRARTPSRSARAARCSPGPLAVQRRDAPPRRAHASTAYGCARTGAAPLPARRGAAVGAPRARRASIFERAAERTAPGQVACLYAGDLVVGHGTIAA